MSTPTPTEAHLDLALQIADAIARSGNVAAAKLIADSEARAVLKQTAYLKAMVQDGTNAMKERDQLRAENATLRAAQKACEACDEPTAFEVRQLRARAEKAEGQLKELVAYASALEDQLDSIGVQIARDSLAIGQDNCDDAYDELATDCAELRADVVRLTARAERAEAELAKYLSACPASPTEEERKRCQQWWAISGKSQ